MWTEAHKFNLLWVDVNLPQWISMNVCLQNLTVSKNNLVISHEHQVPRDVLFGDIWWIAIGQESYAPDVAACAPSTGDAVLTFVLHYPIRQVESSIKELWGLCGTHGGRKHSEEKIYPREPQNSIGVSSKMVSLVHYLFHDCCCHVAP